MKTWPPHPSPDSNWTDIVKLIYKRGCDRIDRLRQQIDDDGVCPIPFQCYCCDKMKSDLEMMSGDDVPICKECIDRQVQSFTDGVVL